MTMPERFMAKVEKTDGCWLWTAATSPYGYGRFNLDGSRTVQAHRLSYELHVGPIPEGLDLDHTCHSNDESCAGGSTCPHRRCVNPARLEPCTTAENTRRGRSYWRAKNHCRRGHPYEGANVRIRYDGARICVTCDRASKARHKQRVKDGTSSRILDQAAVPA